MDALKKIFPFSFKQKDSIAALIINILLYLVVGVIIGFVVGIIALIPIIGLVGGLIGGLIDLYVLAGIVISILDYCKVLK